MIPASGISFKEAPRENLSLRIRVVIAAGRRRV